jgi:hypothetical protein
MAPNVHTFSTESESYVTTDGQPACLSWNKAPISGLRPDLIYCLTVAGLLIWGALSEERTGLSFTIAAGPRQRSHFLLSQICHSQLSLSLMFRPTVSRPICLGAKHPSGAYDQIFITCVTVTVLFFWGALSHERSGLSFVYAAGPWQRSLSRVRVPWDLRPYFTVSHLRLPFRRLLRLAGSRWRYSTPPPHG